MLLMKSQKTLMGRLSVVIETLALAALALAWAGCSTVHPKAYNSVDAPSRLHAQETNGIRVSVDVVYDQPRNKKYFGTDTLDKGIVPVFVRVENLSGAGSILVEKERFQVLVNADVDARGPLDRSVEHETKGGQVVGGAGALLLSTPLIIIGSAMISTADEVRQNFAEKELRNQSLAAGRSVEGFIYCVRPQRKEPVQQARISIPLRNLQTDQEVKCEFLIQRENTK